MQVLARQFGDQDTEFSNKKCVCGLNLKTIKLITKWVTGSKEEFYVTSTSSLTAKFCYCSSWDLNLHGFREMDTKLILSMSFITKPGSYGHYQKSSGHPLDL